VRRTALHAKQAIGRTVERPSGVDAIGAISMLRELITLAWPIAAGMLSETLLGLVDTKLVGGIGTGALAGVGVASMLMYLNYSTVFGVMRAVKVRTAFAVGEGRPADGARYATVGAILAGALGIVVWVVTRDITSVLGLLHIDPRIVPYAREYMAAVTYGAPATCALTALVNHRQALGDTRTPMTIGMAGNVVNVFLSFGLIYGHFGLPRLGVAGCGYGTASVEYLELFVMLALLRRDVRAGAGTLPYRKAAREVLAIGVPTGLHFGGECLAFTAFVSILGSIGGAEMAAHQIALATIRTSFLPGVAVGEASCILVGRALGARRLDRADRANRAALITAATFMTACGIVFGIFGPAIAHAFTHDPDVVRIATHLLLVAALFQVLDAFNVVLRGSLRGAADVRATAVIGIAITWTCVPTAAFFLGRVADWGALGGWFGFLVETSLSSLLFGRRWTHGAWRKQYETPACTADTLRAAA
jgi:MATE family multidrug resistance protein